MAKINPFEFDDFVRSQYPQPQQNTEQQEERGWLGNIASGFTSGATGVIGGITNLLPENAVSNYLEDVEKRNQREREYGWNDIFSSRILDYITDPSGAAYDVANQAGSMAALAPAAYFAPEGAVAAILGKVGTKLLPLFGSTVGRWGASQMAKYAAGNPSTLANAIRWGFTSIPESLSEAGQVNKEARDAGYDDHYARAAKTFAANMAVLPLSNTLEGALLGGALFKPSAAAGESLARRAAMAPLRSAPSVIAEGVQNGSEEAAQQMASNYALGRPLMEGVADAAAVGAVGSMFLGGAGSGMRAMRVNNDSEENRPATSALFPRVQEYNMPTQGADITEQVSALKSGWSNALPQIGGVLKNLFGVDAEISSAGRSEEHNAEVGGAENSYHIIRGNGGDAIDIVLPDDTPQAKLDAIEQYFKDLGMFEEAMFHDVGSGNHLHLGGLQGAQAQTTDTQSDPAQGIESEAWREAQWVESQTGVPAEFIYRQWAHESGNFQSQLARENNNFGGLTQEESNGEDNKQPDGNNYYREFANMHDYAQAYVNDFLRHYDLSNVKSIEDFVRVLKDNGYFGADYEDYLAGVKGIDMPSVGQQRFDVSTASDDDFKNFLEWGKDVSIGDSPEAIGRNADLFKAAWTQAGKGNITPEMRQEVAAAMSPEDWAAYDQYRADHAQPSTQAARAAQSAPMNAPANIQMQTPNLDRAQAPVQVQPLHGQAALTGPQSAGQGARQQAEAQNAARQEGVQKAQAIQQQNALTAEGNQLADGAKQLGIALPQPFETALRNGDSSAIQVAKQYAAMMNGGMQNANQLQTQDNLGAPAQSGEAGGYPNQNAKPRQGAATGAANQQNQVVPRTGRLTKQEMDLAADEITAADPKNFGKGYRTVRDFYNQQIDEILQPALNTLQGGMQQGVELVPWTDGSGRQSRLSNNAPWYRDFYKKNGRKPTKAELRQMAKQLVSNDAAAPNVEGWTPGTAEEAQAMRATAARIADLERKIAALDAVKDKVAKGKKKKSTAKKSNEKVREKSAPKSEEKQNPAAQEAAQQEKKTERKETIAEETKAAQNGSDEARETRNETPKEKASRIASSSPAMTNVASQFGATMKNGKPVFKNDKQANAFLKAAQAMQIDEGNQFSITTWTGSAADYDKPSLKYVGTGEGAQAHGYGLYSAEQRWVAEGYRDRLGVTLISDYIDYDGNTYVNYGGTFNDWFNDDTNEPINDFSLLVLFSAIKEAKGNKAEAKRDIKDRLASDHGTIYHDSIEDALNLLEKGTFKYEREVLKSGTLYENQIDNEDTYLDEQLSFGGQPEKIQEVIRKIVKDIKDKGLDEVDSRLEDFVAYYDVYTGKQIYKMLVHLENDINQEENPQRAASELLNKYGIGGITYDGFSDGRCYVTFDDNALKIIAKYSASEENKRIQELLATREWLSEDQLSKQQKAIADFGMEMGVPVVFFKADPDLHGYHVGGVTFLNVNSAVPIQDVFWHESFHWMRNNNPELYDDMMIRIQELGIFSDEDIESYKESIGRPELTNAQAIEEMLADAMMDKKQRDDIMQRIATADKGLIERFMAWLRETMQKFQEFMRNPEAGLTQAKIVAMNKEIADFVRKCKDDEGNRIFRMTQDGEVLRFDGSPLPSVAYSFAGKKAKNADISKMKEAQKMEKEGKSAREIWDATGWVKGKDKEWRFEIPDNLNDINLEEPHLKYNGEAKLSYLYKNPALYKAYPWLKNVIVKTEKMGKRTWGYAAAKEIVLNSKKLTGKDAWESKKTIIHELQHLIQAHEGFAVGGAEEYVKENLAKLLEKDKRLKRRSKSYLYKHLAGEQEARAAETRAERNTLRLSDDPYISDAADNVAVAKEVFEEVKRESTPKQLAAMRKRQALQRAIDKTVAEHGDMTDEQVDRMEELEELMGEELADVYDDFRWAQLSYDYYKEHRTKLAMPRPHFHDALVYFGGLDMPYSAKQDESQDGKEKKSVDNIGLGDYNKVKPKKPWQDGSIDRAVFDKYLNEVTMDIVRTNVDNDIKANLNAIKNSKDYISTREGLRYFNVLKAWANEYKKEEAKYNKFITMLEYARRCFDNDERAGIGFDVQTGGHDGSRGSDKSSNETIPGKNEGRGGSNDGKGSTVNRNLIGEYRKTQEHFLKLLRSMEKEKHSFDGSAFSTSEAKMENGDPKDPVFLKVRRANLNRDIGTRQAEWLQNRANELGGHFSTEDAAAFFAESKRDFDKKKAELVGKKVSDEQATKAAIKYAEDEAEKKRKVFMADANKMFMGKNLDRPAVNNLVYSVNLSGKTKDTNKRNSEVEKQMAAVRKQYEGTDKWMKAPNGKDTNLTEQQWLAVRTPYFKEFFGDWENDTRNASKVLDENGEPKTVHHGTGRADRVGYVFLPERATSGPMAFFTDSFDIATNYSKNKQDTSLSRDEDDYLEYKNQFTVPVKGRRNPMKIGDAWWYLSKEQREKIAKLAPSIGLDDDEKIAIIPGNKSGLGGYDYHLKQFHGNHMKALIEEWLQSGMLFKEEEQFLKVLKLAGLDNVTYNDPYKREEAVYTVFLNIRKPFDATSITKTMLAKLESAARKAQKSFDPQKAYNADSWDKTSMPPSEWIDHVHDDIKNGTSYAWTVVPDFVTDILKKAGYDGIQDMGGKRGGEGHTVYIPFSSTQIKSATDNIGTYDSSNPDIRYSVGKSVQRANKLDADNNEQAKKKAMAKADKNLAKEAAKQAKLEEKRKEQRAKDIAEGRLVENGRTKIQRPENKGSMGLFDMIFNSPSRLAAKFPAFKPYFDLADKAMRKLTMLRETWGKDLSDALTLAKDDKGRETLYSILWEGDAQGKEFSDAELKREFNASQAVIDAYHSVRSLMDRIYTALDDARRRPKLHAKEEMTKEKLAELKSQPQFYDVLRVDDGKDGHVNVTYREFANWEKTRTLDKDQYEKFKKDDAIQILDEKQNKDGSYTVKTRETIPHIAKRGGYIPHFFHNFMVRVVDKDGNSRTIDSTRTEAEAIKKAKAFEKNLGEGEKLVISPKTFDFKALGVDEKMLAVVLGDKDYNRMMQNLQKHGDMTLEEAEKFARRHGKSRFNGQFLQRMGAKGFEESMEWVLKHHVNMSARYVAMQDFKPNALSLFERMYGDFSKDYKGLADYTKDYINDVNGVPSNLEQAITNTLMSIPFYRKYVVSHFGDRAALQLASDITGKVSIAKLGFLNVSSALLNLTQIANAAGYLGDVGVLWNGIRRGAHGNYDKRYIYENGNEKVTEQQVLDDTGVQYDIGLDSGGGYDKFRPGELAAKSMYFFKKSEAIVRRGTVLAAYKAGRERGMDHEQAIEYANEINRKSNFEYGVQDAPNAFRRGSILSQIIFQFKKYPIKELEVMRDMLTSATDKKQKAIFWGTYFMLAGLFQIPFGEWIEEIAEFFGFRPGPTVKKWMMQAAGDDPAKQALAKVAMYGAPSLTGVDISQRYGMGGVLPSDMYLGKNPTYLDAALSLMGASTDTAKNIVTALRGVFRGDKNETFASLRGISPGVSNMVEAAIGEKYDRRGRVATRYDSAYDRILKAIGFRSTKEAVSTELRNIVYDEKEEKRGEKQKAIDKYLDDPTTENARKLRELGVKPDTVKKARQQRKLDNLARTQENMTKKERKEYQDLMKFAK